MRRRRAPSRDQADQSFRDIQARYSATEIAPAKSARSRGSYLRVSFKNTRETAQAINGWKLQRAQTFLENVIEKKEAVPMRRYCGSIGRSAQGTNREDEPLFKDPGFGIWELGKGGLGGLSQLRPGLMEGLMVVRNNGR